MKFVIDENLPPRLAAWLEERGHDAVHVLQLELGGRPDHEIVALAVLQNRIIVTRDTDYDPIIRARVLRLGVSNASTAKLLTWFEPQLEDACARLTAERLVILR